MDETVSSTSSVQCSFSNCTSKVDDVISPRSFFDFRYSIKYLPTLSCQCRNLKNLPDLSDQNASALMANEFINNIQYEYRIQFCVLSDDSRSEIFMATYTLLCTQGTRRANRTRNEISYQTRWFPKVELLMTYFCIKAFLTLNPVTTCYCRNQFSKY